MPSWFILFNMWHRKPSSTTWFLKIQLAAVPPNIFFNLENAQPVLNFVGVTEPISMANAIEATG